MTRMLFVVCLVPTLAQAEMRVWTSTANTQVTAEIVDVQQGAVVLRTQTGKQISVDYKKLSQHDQAFSRKWAEERHNSSRDTLRKRVAERKQARLQAQKELKEKRRKEVERRIAMQTLIRFKDGGMGLLCGEMYPTSNNGLDCPTRYNGKVLDVVDENNMLVVIHIEEKRSSGGVRSIEDAAISFQVGGSSSHWTLGESVVVWVEAPTKGIVDDMPVPPSIPFQITGTKEYKAAKGGTSTVFVVKPM